jgi:tRNA A-37 threonylcarbamoyl transferase component Bud32
MSKSSLCFPLTSYFVSSRKNWTVGTYFSTENSYGEIWQACLAKDCNYILKWQKYGVPKDREELNYEKVTKTTIIHEINMQKKFAELNLAPEVTDSWFCLSGGVIVMPALKITIRLLLEKYTSSEVKHTIIGCCLGLLNRLHGLGYVHGDPHLNNIMVDTEITDSSDSSEEENELNEYKRLNYKYYFIDMGRSQILEGTLENRKLLMRNDYSVFTTDTSHFIENDTVRQYDIQDIPFLLHGIITNL